MVVNVHVENKTCVTHTLGSQGDAGHDKLVVDWDRPPLVCVLLQKVQEDAVDPLVECVISDFFF